MNKLLTFKFCRENFAWFIYSGMWRISGKGKAEKFTLIITKFFE